MWSFIHLATLPTPAHPAVTWGILLVLLASKGGLWHTDEYKDGGAPCKALVPQSCAREVWPTDHSKMKRILRRLREKISPKDLPPPYSERADERNEIPLQEPNDTPNTPACEVIDLLANCKISTIDDSPESSVEYAEIGDMGLWHSTPLAQRHKSKISLTWVLKENLENAKVPNVKTHSAVNKGIASAKVASVEQNQRHNQKLNEIDRHRKCKSREVKDRVVGRNEYYHNLRLRNVSEDFVVQDTYSDTSVGTEEYVRRKHRHRHRRKKKNQNGKFGYDIKDLDSFLTEATIDRPGNIPVVIAYPTILYQTHKETQQELTLPLGTVVNAVFKNEQWLYAQTPHGDEGYVMYGACLPLGILPNRTSAQKKTPCWESSTDIYPRPCGNLTDNEKENLRGRTRSECRYQRTKRKPNSCAERDFDSLYLKTKSASSIKDVKRQMLLVVNCDYEGSAFNKTLSVNKGEVVVLVRGGVEADVDSEWFYVRKKDGSQGFIPAVVAGHGYI